MRNSGLWLVALLVVLGSVAVYGDQLHIQPSWRSQAAGDFDQSDYQRQVRLASTLADAHEPRFRLYSSSIASSQNDAGSSGSFSSVQSSTGYRKHLHLVPFSGYQIGGEFEDELTETDLEISDAATAGFLVNYDYSKSSQIEFYYSHQETELSSGGLTVDDDLFDLDVDYFHIGGTMKFGEDKWVPYVVGTLGLTRFDPDESQADSLTRFSLGFGGGFRYMPIQRLGIYLGARAFVTFIDSDYVYVSEGGESTLLISSDTLWQFQFMAGVVFVF